VKNGWGGLLAGVVGAALILLWVGFDGYRQTLVTTTATYALIALGMYVPYLMAGSLSMAYGAYAGIGGYAVGLLSTKTGLPLALAWLIGPLVAAAVAVVLGLVTRRLSGFFLAAVTLLFGMAFSAWLVDAEGISGGSGRSSWPPPWLCASSRSCSTGCGSHRGASSCAPCATRRAPSRPPGCACRC
jgi:branched-chain amino acid transport system permease protein